jgi:hypothetical protein
MYFIIKGGHSFQEGRERKKKKKKEKISDLIAEKKK